MRYSDGFYLEDQDYWHMSGIQRDVLLYHPYDRFSPVQALIQTAARDPRVVAIKITLYRVGPDSPIVRL